MSISEIIHVFLFSLATKASPMIKSDIFLKIFQLLESIIKRFLNWIDINYTSVFKFNNIFYQRKQFIIKILRFEQDKVILKARERGTSTYLLVIIEV